MGDDAGELCTSSNFDDVEFVFLQVDDPSDIKFGISLKLKVTSLVLFGDKLIFVSVDLFGFNKKLDRIRRNEIFKRLQIFTTAICSKAN